MLNKYILCTFLLTAWAVPALSQVSNNNEDEVNKIDSRYANQNFVSGQVLVKFKDANRVSVRRAQGKFASTNVNKVTTVLQKYGADEMEQLLPNEKPNRLLKRAKAYNGDIIQEHDLSQLYCVKLSVEHQHQTIQMVEELKELDEVEFAEPNYYAYALADPHIADDHNGNPMENQQWYLDNYGVKELWNKPVINQERPVIAILDTGVDLTHSDLKENLWTNTIEELGIKDNDNDGNGFKNDVHGWDFVNNTGNIRDNNMHGTHVAGIAAAANNGIGIIGANPMALIMPITVLQSDGAGDIATIIKGIDYAIANGATVLNLSLGTYINSLALRQALENAYEKAVIVAAAGNDGRCIYSSHYPDTHQNPKSMPCFPAAYSFVLGVQATTQSGVLAAFSNYDDDGPLYSCESSFFDPDGFNYELKAPGYKMLSTIPGGNYKELNGTSMAAPLVAGAISALKMVKQYDTQELLWVDLLHTNTIAQAYSLTKRPAELEVMKLLMRDSNMSTNPTENDYGGDNEIDAGEVVSIYPVLRTSFGEASNIKMKLEVDENEDPNVVRINTGDVDFGWHLDAYGKETSKNPLIIKVADNVSDARYIRMKIIITCDESEQAFESPFSIRVCNMIKMKGLISEDKTLTADRVYYINGDLGVNEGATLTIEPGTRIELAEGTGIYAFGDLVAKGTPQKPITFARHAGEGPWTMISAKTPTMPDKKGNVLYTNSDSTLFTLLPTDETPIQLDRLSKMTYRYSTEEDHSESFNLIDYLEDWEENKTGRENLLTDPNYITPAVLNLIKDWKAAWSPYPTESVDGRRYTSYFNANFVSWYVHDEPVANISYCRLDGFTKAESYMTDCILTPIGDSASSIYFGGVRNVIVGSIGGGAVNYNLRHSNIVNNEIAPSYSSLNENNFFNNAITRNNQKYYLSIIEPSPVVDHALRPSYLGTCREDLIRPYIYEVGNTPPGTWDNLSLLTFGIIDLSNMPKEPIREAHGIVWKVLVNDKDAQDEFEDLAPLGVGKHKFEVYFNRPMNKLVTPRITFGVCEPYTQHAVSEEGCWNEEGTIYTAYKTITGKTNSDGSNRINVYGAEDDEFFEIPYEKSRFNFILQAAGSMAMGFEAEAGLGRIELKWNNEGNNFEDAMGFNIYRYHQQYHSTDTMRINQDVLDIEATEFVDYDVVPGETYYYYYKVLSTDLQEFDASNIVAATPLTSTRGDANGSGAVDVADVITTVNYITKQNPQPFIFEAADMNADIIIDILDVMGIVKGIINQELLTAAKDEDFATYIVENGTLFVENSMPLGGVQVQLTFDGNSKKENVRTADDLYGFEQASAWLSDNDYLFLAYSLNGKSLYPGRHALLHIGDADIASIRLSDTFGRNVKIENNGTTGIDRMGKHVMNVEGSYDLQGRKLSTLTPLKKGIYIINGNKVVK